MANELSPPPPKTSIYENVPEKIREIFKWLEQVTFDASLLKGVPINDSAKADGKILQYNGTLDELEYIAPTFGPVVTREVIRVSLWGDDSGNGTWDYPFKTIQKAINTAIADFPGEFVAIVIEPGMYNESLTANLTNGTSILLQGRVGLGTFLGPASGPILVLNMTDQSDFVVQNIFAIGSDNASPALILNINLNDSSKEVHFDWLGGAIAHFGSNTGIDLNILSDVSFSLKFDDLLVVSFEDICMDIDTTGATGAGDVNLTIFNTNFFSFTGASANPIVKALSPLAGLHIEWQKTGTLGFRPFNRAVELDGNIDLILENGSNIQFGGGAAPQGTGIYLTNGAILIAPKASIGHGPNPTDYSVDISAGCNMSAGLVSTPNDDYETDFNILGSLTRTYAGQALKYNNSISGLVANQVQDAIDEIAFGTANLQAEIKHRWGKELLSQEFTYTNGLITQKRYYDTDGGALKYQIDYTYAGNELSQYIVTRLSDFQTQVFIMNYSGGNLSKITVS